MSLPDGPDRSSVGCVCLIVMDGWGIAPPGPGNAITLAHTPVFDELWAATRTSNWAPRTSVGLPEGQMGNSEVGHLTLGAGAAVPQTLDRSTTRSRRRARENEVSGRPPPAQRVHLLGLCSDGGVHSGSSTCAH